MRLATLAGLGSEEEQRAGADSPIRSGRAKLWVLRASAIGLLLSGCMACAFSKPMPPTLLSRDPDTLLRNFKALLQEGDITHLSDIQKMLGSPLQQERIYPVHNGVVTTYGPTARSSLAAQAQVHFDSYDLHGPPGFRLMAAEIGIGELSNLVCITRAKIENVFKGYEIAGAPPIPRRAFWLRAPDTSYGIVFHFLPSESSPCIQSVSIRQFR